MYVFTKVSSTSWMQETKLYASETAAYDNFGMSVSLHKDEALIGAVADDDQGTNAGSVYVFSRTTATTWTQQTKLYASDPSAAALGNFALVFLCTGTPHSLGLTLIAQKERDRGQSTYSRDRLIWMELLVLGLNRRRFTRPLR